MTSECSEAVGKIYTTVVFQPNSIHNLALSRRAISLIQEPKEKVHIEIRCLNLSKYYLEFVMEFRDYPISILENYGYEVRCEALIEENGKRPVHRQLFSHRPMRTDRKISFINKIPWESLSNNVKVYHLCLHIHRFNADDSLRVHTSSAETFTLPSFFRGAFPSDVSLAVQDKIIPAHRAILSGRSIVFEAMFAHQMTENKDGVVKISDADPEVVQEMVDYVYSGKSEKLAEFPLRLFEVAHKYELRDLELKCQEYMLFNITPENVLDIRELGWLYDLDDLTEATNIYIEERDSELLKGKSFTKFLCRTINAKNLIKTLELFVKMNCEDGKIGIFDYLKRHPKVFQDIKLGEYLRDKQDLFQEMATYIPIETFQENQ